MEHELSRSRQLFTAACALQAGRDWTSVRVDTKRGFLIAKKDIPTPLTKGGAIPWFDFHKFVEVMGNRCFDVTMAHAFGIARSRDRASYERVAIFLYKGLALPNERLKVNLHYDRPDDALCRLPRAQLCYEIRGIERPGVPSSSHIINLSSVVMKNVEYVVDQCLTVTKAGPS